MTAEAARLTGLAEGTPLWPALHDVTASALGMGGYGKGVVAVIAGTYSISETVSSERRGSMAAGSAATAILPGQWNNMSISPASTANYDWFIEQFVQSSAQRAERPARASMRSSAPGRSRPHFGARRASSSIPISSVLPMVPRPRAPVSSASVAWHDRGDMVRAVLEGIAFNHRVHVDALRDGFAFDVCTPYRRRLAQPRPWPDCSPMSSACRSPATETDEARRLGAALCAGAGAGLFAAPPERSPLISRRSRDHCLSRIPTAQRATTRNYRLFRDIAEAMTPLWPKIRGSRLGASPQAELTLSA